MTANVEMVAPVRRCFGNSADVLRITLQYHGGDFLLRQKICCSQAGWTGSDDGDSARIQGRPLSPEMRLFVREGEMRPEIREDMGEAPYARAPIARTIYLDVLILYLLANWSRFPACQGGAGALHSPRP